MNRPRHQDYYSIKAKKEQYPARSAYKLQEIDDKYKVFATASRVLDLGSAPGSWLMVARERMCKEALLIGCDIQPLRITLSHNTYFFQDSIFERSPQFTESLTAFAPFDVIMSDMAPNTTGSFCTDAARSLALCEEAFFLSQEFLASHGILITKVFMGGDIQGYQNLLREHFISVKSFKPKSTKKESKEIFYIARGRKEKPIPDAD